MDKGLFFFSRMIHLINIKNNQRKIFNLVNEHVFLTELILVDLTR